MEKEIKKLDMQAQEFIVEIAPNPYLTAKEIIILNDKVVDKIK